MSDKTRSNFSEVGKRLADKWGWPNTTAQEALDQIKEKPDEQSLVLLAYIASVLSRIDDLVDQLFRGAGRQHLEEKRLELIQAHQEDMDNFFDDRIAKHGPVPDKVDIWIRRTHRTRLQDYFARGWGFRNCPVRLPPTGTPVHDVYRTWMKTRPKKATTKKKPAPRKKAAKKPTPKPPAPPKPDPIPLPTWPVIKYETIPPVYRLKCRPDPKARPDNERCIAACRPWLVMQGKQGIYVRCAAERVQRLKICQAHLVQEINIGYRHDWDIELENLDRYEKLKVKNVNGIIG